MVHLKGCPRCQGDLVEERYLEGSELVCLQCGRVMLGRSVRQTHAPAALTPRGLRPARRELLPARELTTARRRVS